MNNEPLYNRTFTLITEKEYSKSNKVYNFFGEESKILFDIQNYQINNDVFFNGHIIVKDINLIETINLETFFNFKIEKNNIFTTKVVHDGVDSECFIDDSILICSSWVLPYVLNTSRTNNTLYGDIISHRIKINTFNLNK